MTSTDFIDTCLLLDLETGENNRIYKIGAVFSGRTLERKGNFKLTAALAELDTRADQAKYILGHNIISHDLPILAAQAPHLNLLNKPVVDTLYLSPLAFPENPYHRLVKDYKLVRDSLNDPVADARLAASVFSDQWESFVHLHRTEGEILSFYRYCFSGGHTETRRWSGLAAVFAALGAPVSTENEASTVFQREGEGRACATAVTMVAFNYLLNPEKRPALAYSLAWLRVSGFNSVLPPWVRQRFPDVVPILRHLRETPCASPACVYCRTNLDPVQQVQRYFGFAGFRALPATSDGRSLQEEIVRHGMGDRPQLAILPTGGGKSLCFQTPALVRHCRRGVLTVVISPLQALMKDQVDGLAAKTGMTSAAAIYGMLTPPERGEVLERIRLGDIALLYVSPEQLRNKSVSDAISQREIGCWVFDEAHCLSKWGHDFRPDYLYAARFIREFATRQQTPIPPIACFTATAKRDVRDEIVDHFRRELGQELQVFEGGVERGNLSFEVQMVTGPEKYERIHLILAEHLPQSAAGSAVVFTATRKEAEQTRDFLVQKGWSVAAFHAGLEVPEKRRIQDEFIAGAIQVICATNAFGMGIDKENVRLVIHADIPGSLENYLQEAGRAGRDATEAKCILLYNEQDIETQFKLGSYSELSHHDIVQILRGLRRARKNKHNEVVITTGELLRDEEVQTGFDFEDRQADTKVKTAIAWLERAGFVERNQNNTRVFQGYPLVRNLQEAQEKMAGLNLSRKRERRWLAVLQALFNARVDEGMSADDLAELPEFKETREPTAYGASYSGDTQEVLRTLFAMAECGLIKQGILLTAFIRYKVSDHSRLRFDKICLLEEAMLKTMQEAEPDAEGWLDLSLRKLNQRLVDAGLESVPELLRTILKSLSLDGKGLAGNRGSLEFRPVGQDHYRLKLHRDWPALCGTAQRRRDVARVALDVMYAKIPENTPAGADILVNFAIEEIAQAIRSDLFLAGQVKDILAAIDRGLMFLHEQKVIILQQGLAVFRQAMTICIVPGEKGRRYSKGDFSPLEQHYKERIFQVHVMNEYARMGIEKIKQALELVLAYFTMERGSFVQRYFPGRKEIIDRATSQESYHRIVDSLGNPVQLAVVAAQPDDNMLILAGPGSGKTRVVVHRCAYLLRVKRVPARSILILTFCRNAATTLRRRLWDLVGPDARGVTIQTYHGLAMRLTGSSFAARADQGKLDDLDFATLMTEAISLLSGEKEVSGLEPDVLRERLLAGYRHILVDEYQDIEEAQYQLISALAGRTQADPDSKLSILAVGDDDQNIYTFRGANVAFIRRFQEDYQARNHYLVENYRSTAHIIAAANSLIAHNRDRMKTDRPIRINQGRTRLPAGGAWTFRDPVAQGRVQVLTVADARHQAAVLVAELLRLRERQPSLQWAECAVLAETWEELAPVRAICEQHGIPVTMGTVRKALPLTRIREVVQFLDLLKGSREGLVTPENLTRMMVSLQGSQPDNCWWEFLRELLEEWRKESGDAELPVSCAIEFIYETLMEQRREQTIGRGIFLSTVHSAKGMEFPHVFVPGGGWAKKKGLKESEEERRVYYVAMTRAQETLCLFDRRDAPNPHTKLLDGDCLLRREPPVIALPDEALMLRRYEMLGMKDLYLDYAGRKVRHDAIHQHLADLAPGDQLQALATGRSIGLYTTQGSCIALLSESGSTLWRDRLDRIEGITVLAMVQRTAEDSGDKYRQLCNCDRWELPWVEVTYADNS